MKAEKMVLTILSAIVCAWVAKMVVDIAGWLAINTFLHGPPSSIFRRFLAPDDFLSSPFGSWLEAVLLAYLVEEALT